eukprot:6031476-Amphidinium_carterae.1
MPYRSWCPICVKAKGQSVHHRQGALKEQSLMQLDYACTHSQEMAGTYNADMCGDYDRTLHGNPYIKEGSYKTSVDTFEEVRHGEWIRTVNYTG